jgi:conjugative coupling factor TraD (SXT/TOL subfamily)
MNFYITKLDQLLIRYCEEFISHKDSKYEQWINHFISQNTKQDRRGKQISPSRKDAILEYAEEAIENQTELYHVENNLLTDLTTACRLDRTYYDKITASVGPLLEKLTTGKVAELLSPDYNNLKDERPILDWLQVIRNKQIVYVGMDALTDTVVSSTVGNAMLSDLVSVAGHLYNFGISYGYGNLVDQKISLPRICLHSDEFNEVIGNEFIPLLNKARGVGFNVVAYTQTWSDVEARLVSTAKAGQVAGNLNTLIMFRTKEAKTVDMLLNQLSKVLILRVIPASSSSDSPHGEEGIFYQSSNEDRLSHTEVRLIEQNDVLNLPKGQAFCLLEGGKLHKIRVPLPQQDNIKIPSSIESLIAKMREKQK